MGNSSVGMTRVYGAVAFVLLISVHGLTKGRCHEFIRAVARPLAGRGLRVTRAIW